MKLVDQVQAIVEALRPWAESLRGTVSIAADPEHALELIRSTAPGSLHVVVWPERAEKRGEYEEASYEDRHIAVTVCQGRGLSVDRGQVYSGRERGQRPLWDLVEEVRDVLRSVSLDAETTEVTLDYQGWEPLELAPDEIAAAYRIRVSIGTALPAIQTD